MDQNAISIFFYKNSGKCLGYWEDTFSTPTSSTPTVLDSPTTFVQFWIRFVAYVHRTNRSYAWYSVQYFIVFSHNSHKS